MTAKVEFLVLGTRLLCVELEFYETVLASIFCRIIMSKVNWNTLTLCITWICNT